MKRILVWTIAALAVMALFALAASAAGWTDEARVSRMIEAVRSGTGGRMAAAALIAGLLALDLVLPTPSSILMTLSGAVLGIATGTFVSMGGAMASALLGYGLCRRYGREWFRRTVGGSEAVRVEAWVRRHGAWAIIVSRSVPMLTELVSCAAGLTGMPPATFVALSAAGTLPICAVYAWAGAQSADPLGLRWAVVLAFALPAAGLALVRFLPRHRAPSQTAPGGPSSTQPTPPRRGRTCNP